MILHKVSFDVTLFEKELRKAIKSLVPEEMTEFRDWCYHEFGHLYKSVLNHCFTLT